MRQPRMRRSPLLLWLAMTVAACSSEEIGDPEGDQPGIIVEAGAKELGKDLVPDQPQYTADENRQTDLAGSACGSDRIRHLPPSLVSG